MGEKAQIHVQVDADTKTEWERYAEESGEIGNNSLSALIRRAVTKHINSDTTAGDGDGDAVSIDLSSIEEQQAETEKTLAELRNVVDRMDTRLSEVQRDVSASATKQSLEERLFQALPPARPHSEPWARAKPDGPLPKDNRKWDVAWTGRLEDIAVVARDAESIIERQLDELPTESAEIDGEVRYWLED